MDSVNSNSRSSSATSLGLKVFSLDEERIWRTSLPAPYGFDALVSKVRQVTNSPATSLLYEVDGELVSLDSNEALTEALLIGTDTDKLGRKLLRITLATMISTEPLLPKPAEKIEKPQGKLQENKNSPTTTPTGTPSTQDTEKVREDSMEQDDLEQAALSFIQRVLRSLNNGTPAFAIVLSLMPGGSLHEELDATVFKAYPALRRAAIRGSNPWCGAGGGCSFMRQCHRQQQQQNPVATFEAAVAAAAAAVAENVAQEGMASANDEKDGSQAAAATRRTPQQRCEAGAASNFHHEQSKVAKDFEEAIQRAIAASLKCSV